MDASGIDLGGSDLVEAIARRVVELLKADGNDLGSRRYVDAATLAQQLDVDRDWVYAHAGELGAIRLGGPRGRLRFDVELVRERMKPLEPGRISPTGRPRSKRSETRPTPRESRVGSSIQKQRRASGRTPAPSPRQHHPGGSPK